MGIIVPKLDFLLCQYKHIDIISPKVNMVVIIGIINRYIAALGNSVKKIKDDNKVIHSLAIPIKKTKFKIQIKAIAHL
ncbi:hypothetical protein B5S50_08710 [Clostridium sp. 001]|nr:hypothetical protein B5S50_08710 [Clostridium sp. 001]